MSDEVKVTNLPAFDAKVMAWFAAVERATAEVAVGVAKRTFEQIIKTGPQFSGDFVANTKVSVGAPDTTFTPFVLHDSTRNPFQMWDSPAMDYARNHANWPKLTLGQTIYISSSAKHDEFYAWRIESGQIKLRPENAGAYAIYNRAIRQVSNRYTFIGKPQLAILRRVGT